MLLKTRQMTDFLCSHQAQSSQEGKDEFLSGGRIAVGTSVFFFQYTAVRQNKEQPVDACINIMYAICL